MAKSHFSFFSAWGELSLKYKTFIINTFVASSPHLLWRPVNLPAWTARQQNLCSQIKIL